MNVKNAPFDLEIFFHEVTILANQIKKTAFKFHDEEVFLGVGREVLESLENGPRTVPDLAESRNSSRQNVQIMVNRLLRLGCVEMQLNPEHKKSGLVSLTETGRAALLKTTAGEKPLFERISSHCSPKEIQRGFELIAKLRQALATEAGTDEPGARPSPRRASVSLVAKPPAVETAIVDQRINNIVATETEVEENSLPYNLL